MISMKKIILVTVIVVALAIMVTCIIYNNIFHSRLNKVEIAAQRAAKQFGATYVGSYGGDPNKLEVCMAARCGVGGQNIDKIEWEIIDEWYDYDMTILQYKVIDDISNEYIMVWY